MYGTRTVFIDVHQPKRLSLPGGIRLPLKCLRRWLFLGFVAGATLVGISMMLDIVRDKGITALEIVILTLFAATFCWISIPFWNAVIGFALTVFGRDPLSLRRVQTGSDAEPIAGRTAVVMPAHNEDPARVMSGLAAMLRSLADTGCGDDFDVYLLSDTTDSTIARAEEAAWADLRRQPGHRSGLYYRRRAANVDRKAGNIADFCQRWGAHYDFMVVLDADSIMSGSALVELVRAMEANPAAGLIQTVPVPAGRTTPFGRLLQFAGCLYGPMLATGQSFWQTDAANYWGHNAIVRVRAFADHCGLPVLPGSPPIGGAILSHDFVEAALMRRAGWHVYLMPTIGGSYEEVPSNVLDYAKRDRRWAQGSLQHLRLLLAPGLHRMNRLHFLLGAMGYVSSVLWLLMLVASTTYVVLPDLGASSLSSGSEQTLPGWPLHSVSRIVPLLGVTAVLLFVPKLLALTLALVGHRGRFGGATRLLLSALLEILFAAVVAPLMMMYHTRFVTSVLCGHDVTWKPQAREGGDIAWTEAWRNTVGITAVGLTWAAVTLYYTPSFFLWLTPIFTGLILAAPLVRWTSSSSFGQWTRRGGLFLVPSETAPPPELELGRWSVHAVPSLEPIVEAVVSPPLPPERFYAMPRQMFAGEGPAPMRRFDPLREDRP